MEESAVSTITLQQNAVSQLALQADAVGKLAQDTGAFAAVVAAFESNDPDALSWVLQRLELLPQCELICEWIRVKWCGLRCVEVCGPPDPKVPVPNLPEFANALAQLASREALLRRAVDAVACGDAESYRAAIAEAKLQKFCHLLCRYICSTLYRRICEVVCTRQPVAASDAALDIRADAEVLARVFANKGLSGAIAKAAEALDGEALRKEIGAAGFIGNCEIICRIVCIWRCVRECREFCVEPPPILRGTYAVEEARKFALAAQQLAGHPRALSDLVAAVISNNAEAYRAIVDRFGLGPYCWQVCGWVCSEVCYEFCVVVCPPPVQPPEWTNIGNFLVLTDINAAGTTKYAKLSAGGLNYAFFSALNLSGNCPENSPLAGGGQMMYRFTYSDSSVTNQPILDGNLKPIQVGFDQVSWPNMDASGNATATSSVVNRPIYVLNRSDIAGMPFPPTSPPPAAAPWAPPAPATGAKWFTAAVYIWPDSNGWVQVFPSVWGGVVQTFMSFETTTVVAPGNPNPTFPPAPIGGIPVPAASQLNGTNLTLTFEATRVAVPSPPDYTQAPVMIRVNNAFELTQLTLKQFAGPLGCCTPISSELDVLFSVDHEEIGNGDWSLKILSQAGGSPCQANGTTCSPSAPGDITPSVSSPIVSVTARGGSGTVIEHTGGWDPCSYQIWLCTTPRLTDGLNNRGEYANLVTFCICGP
jgi:hypothetical protein